MAGPPWILLGTIPGEAGPVDGSASPNAASNPTIGAVASYPRGHFERGAKIGDSSNRYEHTCKRCGEFFPKGRMKNLTKKCAVMTMKERVQIIMRLNDLVVEDAQMHIFPNTPVREGDNQIASSRMAWKVW